LEFMFSRKAAFQIEITEGIDIEELEFDLIDAGIERIEKDEDGTILIYGDYTSFGTLQTALEERTIEVAKSNLERIPTSPVEFTEEQLIDIDKMLDKIEDDDDIQQVFTNIA